MSIISILLSPKLGCHSGGETRNTKIEDVPVKIGEGNAAGVAPRRFSTLSDINTIITAMKRE
jgi:hypothetical protein